MKKLVERINIIANIFFLIAILYLVSRYFIVHQNTPIQYGNYDEVAVVVALLLAIAIVSLPYFISKKAAIIYVDKVKESSVESADLNGKSSADEISKLPIFIDSVSKIVAIENTSAIKIEKILSLLCSTIQAGQGVVYKINKEQANVVLIASYAFVAKENQIAKYEFGEGLIGLAAKENKMMKLDNVPHGYINIFSGLGSSSPSFLYILPFGDGSSEAMGIIEMALFKDLTSIDFQLIDAAKAHITPILIQL